MLDKMGQDRIFSLKVRGTVECCIFRESSASTCFRELPACLWTFGFTQASCYTAVCFLCRPFCEEGCLDWQGFLELALVYRLLVWAIACQEQQVLNLLSFTLRCVIPGKRPLLSNRIDRLRELQLSSFVGIVLFARLFPVCKTRSAEEVSDF